MADDLSLFANDGTGLLSTAAPIGAGTNPSSINVGRLVGGPSPDLVAAVANGVLVYENLCGASGDSDNDGDVDLRELGTFQVCFDGPADAPGCLELDVAPNGVIDIEDYLILFSIISGPSR